MITIIIVNFNGLKYLDNCLVSLTHQTYRNFEIILVDNASSDGSAGYVHTRYPFVKIIENTENRGFAGGVNEGIRFSSGDYILTLNNDTIADTRLLEELNNAMDADPKAGMLATKMIFPDGRINSAGVCISRSGAAWDRGMFDEDGSNYNTKQEVFGPCAGAALYRKRMLFEIGLFDEDFFLFMEDVDLAFRARLAGWRCLYIPSARVIHIHGGTAGFKSETSIYYGNRNLIWYVIKNFPRMSLITYSPWIIGRNCAVIFYYLYKGHGRTIIRAKMDAIKGIRKMMRKRQDIHIKISESELKPWIFFSAHIRKQ